MAVYFLRSNINAIPFNMMYIHFKKFIIFQILSYLYLQIRGTHYNNGGMRYQLGGMHYHAGGIY